MPNKEITRSTDPKTGTPGQQATMKTPVAAKIGAGKTIKDTAMSPTGASTEEERTELLGSLTTQQQQRTSARVIKKLKLEPVAEKRIGKGIDDITECETPNKIEDLKFPTVKQRMPKALWSTDEKNLFFEALNEYGKDFDAITAYICAKMKKKGMPDVNLKTKTQVSHFYYRTWHKLSKHVHFDENVKKVAQELYALINYGELRKKLVSVNEKTCARLSEMVLGGSMVVRARGRNVRVRTPMCRALRKLNQITVRCGSRVGSCLSVRLRARLAGSWARVQAAGHNPRAQLRLPPRTALAVLLRALARRWGGSGMKLKPQLSEEGQASEDRDLARADEKEDPEELHLETDRTIIQETKLPKRPVLHLGPNPHVQIHIPVVTPCEQLSSQKICFSSYLERFGSQGTNVGAKIRTPKRQRKDSATDKDKDGDPKKIKIEDSDPIKLINIEETAIDGIELMANYKSNLNEEEKPSTEDEILKSEEIEDDLEMSEKVELERDKDMSEREKDSFSELEDDDKFNKSESDNESDHGKEKAKDNKFENLKVKFRIRPKKRGGSIYSLVVDKDQCQTEEFAKEEEAKPEFDVCMATSQVRKGWSEYDAGDLTIGDLYLMFGSRSKLELEYWWAPPVAPLAPRPRDKAAKTPDKDSSLEDTDKAHSDTDIFSPKNYNQDSNDGLSGDERKGEQLASPDHKSSLNNCTGTLNLVNKLINRVTPAQEDNGFALMSDRLKRLLALVGNPNIPTANGTVSRCNCGHICTQQRKPGQKQPIMQCPQITQREDNSAVFRHPTPVLQAQDTEKSFSLEGLPKWRKRRSRADRRVVVQRLLPLLPKLSPPATNNLIPVRIVPNSPRALLPRIMPKPPPTSTSDLSLFYVLSESNGQFYFHDGDRRIPITPLPEANGGQDCPEDDESEEEEMKELKSEVSSVDQEGRKEDAADKRNLSGLVTPDLANFLPSESMSLSPSRLLRDHDGWFEGQDFSLSSFLGHLEGRPTSQPDLAVDSQLQSLMTESSVDFVAKFSDFAEVADEEHPLPPTDLT